MSKCPVDSLITSGSFKSFDDPFEILIALASNHLVTWFKQIVETQPIHYCHPTEANPTVIDKMLTGCKAIGSLCECLLQPQNVCCLML